MAVLCSQLLTTCSYVTVLSARDPHLAQNFSKAHSTQGREGKGYIPVNDLLSYGLLTSGPSRSYHAWWEGWSAVMHNHSQLSLEMSFDYSAES